MRHHSNARLVIDPSVARKLYSSIYEIRLRMRHHLTAKLVVDPSAAKKLYSIT
jgi:hypothetical protein